jgi:hypothetical protein
LIAYLLVQLGAIANCAEAVRLARARADGRLLHAAAAGVGATLIALFVEYLTHNLMFENHMWLMVGVSFAIRRMAASSEPIGAPALDHAMPSATV